MIVIIYDTFPLPQSSRLSLFHTHQMNPRHRRKLRAQSVSAIAFVYHAQSAEKSCRPCLTILRALHLPIYSSRKAVVGGKKAPGIYIPWLATYPHTHRRRRRQSIVALFAPRNFCSRYEINPKKNYIARAYVYTHVYVPLL